VGPVDDADAARLLGRAADEVPVPPAPVSRLLDAARRQRRRQLLATAVLVLLLLVLAGAVI
jgi:hypothetical protein